MSIHKKQNGARQYLPRTCQYNIFIKTILIFQLNLSYFFKMNNLFNFISGVNLEIHILMYNVFIEFIF